MLDETNTVVSDTGTSEEQTVSAPLENVTSSTDAKETDQTQSLDQGTPQSKIDYLKALDGLQIDPALKENLKAGYLRQEDYTRKTQELAKDRGTLEQYRQVQPVIEFLNKNPDLFNEVYNKMQGNVQPEQGQEQIPQDPKEYADWVKANTIKEMMAIQAREADFQSAAKVDSRLDGDPEFGEMIARMVANDGEFKEGRISAVDATKKAVASFDKYISKAVNSAKTNLSNQAKAKKSGSTVSSSPGSVKGGTQPRTMAEAAKMAEEELGT